MIESELTQKIILLTWKIDIDPKTINTISCPKTRYEHYFKNIKNLLEKSDLDVIIFCENSNAKFKDLSFIENLANKNHKIFEFLPFAWNPLFGKWSWECEIIEYAINNSKYIKNNSFYKLTWRWILKNINQIVCNTQHVDTFFYRQSLFKELILTAFFKTNKTFFDKYLFNCWTKVDPTQWWSEYCLEWIYFNRLKKLKIYYPKVYPNFDWIAGKWIKLDKWFFYNYIKGIISFLWLYKI